MRRQHQSKGLEVKEGALRTSGGRAVQAEGPGAAPCLARWMNSEEARGHYNFCFYREPWGTMGGLGRSACPEQATSEGRCGLIRLAESS